MDLVGNVDHAGERYQLINGNGNQFNVICNSNMVIDDVEATDVGVYVAGWFSQLGDCTCYNLGNRLLVHGSLLGLTIWNPYNAYTVYLPFTRK